MSRSKICNEVAPATSPATAKLAAEEDPCSLGRHANFLPGISPTKELHEIASTNQAVKAGRLSSPSHNIKQAQRDLRRIERSDTLELTAQLPHFGHWVQVVRCCSHPAFDCLNLASAYPMSCITARICTPDSSWLVRSLLVMSCPRGLLLSFKLRDDDLHAHSPLIGQCRHG
jgi:hypothetical protein